MLGATATIANKVLFQLTGKDASDLGAEFAKQPPTEPRMEEELVVSRSPVWDLLRGHKDPRICMFVERYIRPLKDRHEDLTGEMETERIIRLDVSEEANMYRMDERLEATHKAFSDTNKMRVALHQAARFVNYAKRHTEKMTLLQDEILELRINLRGLNRCLTIVMEDQAGYATKALNNFLVGWVHRLGGLQDGEKEKIVLEFVKFCELLRLPENQIKVRTGQFTETQINTRQESDMLGEAVRQLVNLNKYTAFAKVLTAEGVWTGQIKTMALKTEIHEDHKPLYATLVHLHTLPYVKERIDIHAEIIEREEGWRVAESDEPPPITS